MCVNNNIKYMSSLSREEANEMVKNAKLAMHCTWSKEFDDYKYSPYCGICSSNERMERKEYGFKCSNCSNMLGWNMERLVESPFNNVNHIHRGSKPLYPEYKQFFDKLKAK